MTQQGRHSDTDPGGLLAMIAKEHCAELNLCDLLERIADNLLEPLDTELAGTGVMTLRRCLRRHVALEEGHLYPALARRAGRDELTEAMLTQIRGEHAADECLAHDNADQLEHALSRGHVENPQMLGYMLRGFFECRRRHIAWENAIILPLARQRLAEEDFLDFSAEEFEQGIGAENYFKDIPGAICGCGRRHDS